MSASPASRADTAERRQAIGFTVHRRLSALIITGRFGGSKRFRPRLSTGGSGHPRYSVRTREEPMSLSVLRAAPAAGRRRRRRAVRLGGRRLRAAGLAHPRAPRGRRLHPLRTAGAGLGAVPNHLRGDRHARWRAPVLQRDPQGQRGERRGGLRPDDRPAAAVQGGDRGRGAGRRPGERGPRGELHPGVAGQARAGEGRDAPAHREDLQGRQVVLPRRDPHRLQPRPGHHAQRGRAAEGLRTDRLQRAVAGAHRGRRPNQRQLPEHVPGRGAARGEGAPAACVVSGSGRRRPPPHRRARRSRPAAVARRPDRPWRRA